jgi:hypothetical protein
VTESSAVPPDVTRSWRFTSLAKNPLCLVERDFQTQIDLSRSPPFLLLTIGRRKCNLADNSANRRVTSVRGVTSEGLLLADFPDN